MSENIIYILVSYNYYDAEVINMVSRNYNKVKKQFNNLLKNSKNGKGYIIYKCLLDEYYFDNDKDMEMINYVCKDYNGIIKIFEREL